LTSTAPRPPRSPELFLVVLARDWLEEELPERMTSSGSRRVMGSAGPPGVRSGFLECSTCNQERPMGAGADAKAVVENDGSNLWSRPNTAHRCGSFTIDFGSGFPKGLELRMSEQSVSCGQLSQCGSIRVTRTHPPGALRRKGPDRPQIQSLCTIRQLLGPTTTLLHTGHLPILMPTPGRC